MCHHLESLTSFDATYSDKTLDQLHLIHTKALTTARLIKNDEFPMLSQCVATKIDDDNEVSSATTNDDTNAFNPNIRNTCVTIGFCDLWKLSFMPKLTN